MTATSPPDDAGSFQALLLQVTPPRVPRHLVERARLLSSADTLRGHAAFVVQAPAGFGKTSLLAQWRREYLALGVVVAWVSAQASDEPRRLAQSMALAVRVAAGRPGFGRALLEVGAPSGLEGATIFLAELAQTALNVVLIVDEADRLPNSSREVLAYLLRNAPVNLRIVIAARTVFHLGVDDLIDYGQCAAVDAQALRFRFEETLELVQSRFPGSVDSDSVARLHELTEGWPLGLQLALTAMGNAPDPGVELSALSAHGGRVRQHLVSRLLAHLDPEDLDFLTRISILDPLYPELCTVVTRQGDAPRRLERMALDTPILRTSEQGDWLRMHALTRDALQRRFAQLPVPEQQDLHGRAAQWLVAHRRIELAVRHAMEAGQQELACDLAERSLYDFVTAIMSSGQPGVMIEWLAMLPLAALEQRPRLLLAAAWVMALSQRDLEAEQLVERILSQPGADDEVRCECALILSGAALFADDPDRATALHAPWAKAPPLRDPQLRQIHVNRGAYCTLLAGDPALARLRLHQLPSREIPSYLELWGQFHLAMTHVWEVRMESAERLLRSILSRSERDLGRRSPFASQVAALLAAVVWERNASSEALALLAHRLDVIEQTALPACLLLAYRTLASIEAAQGSEARALELLDALHAAGSARGLERICLMSLCDQVRLHARQFRSETCKDLCARIDAELSRVAPCHGPLWLGMVAGPCELAHAYAALAARDWPSMLDSLARADVSARAIRIGRLHIEILALRALALSRGGQDGEILLREAVGLAATHGLSRIFDDAHPELGDWARGVAGPTVQVSGPEPMDQGAEPAQRILGSTALTPKENEILVLLARNLSNKEIGLATQVGENTIKWHMKNLFFKLNAGSRKHVVQRARVLGLLPPAN